MPHSVVWTSQARDDLRSIRAFIARDAPATAAAFTRGIRLSVDRLREFPESGSVVAEVGNPSIRELVHGSYRIIYRVTEARAEVLTVFHSARILDRSNVTPGDY